jgi:nucleotide-binding universal stress UspA family protein
MSPSGSSGAISSASRNPYRCAEREIAAMFEKLLIATDLSPASDCLLQCAGELQAAGLKRAVLAHVIYVANTPGLEDALEAEASPALMRQKESLEAQGIEVTTEMHLGIPARTLNELAERHAVDAVLIGSRGRGILQRAVLGSVAFKLLQTVQKPVLLARIQLLGEGEACRFAVCHRLFEHILHPTDFSETAEHAFWHLEQMAADLKGTVTLLHVQDREYREIHLSGQQVEELKRIDRERLEGLKLRLDSRGVRVETELVEGVPRVEILQRAASGTYSLIAMGTQGKGLFREALLGSLAHEVACTAELPVLFFPGRL